ncbi:MAG: hypothetical protein Q9227_002010 [Pyrenula ochraceoflavens]
MSNRVTRSSARLAAASPSQAAAPVPLTVTDTSTRKRKAPKRDSSPLSESEQPPPVPRPKSKLPTRRVPKRQKVEEAAPSEQQAPAPRSSRRKAALSSSNMSNPGYVEAMQYRSDDADKISSSSKFHEDAPKATPSTSSTKKKGSKSKKPTQGTKISSQPYHSLTESLAERSEPSQPSSSHAKKKRPPRVEEDVVMRDRQHSPPESAARKERTSPPPEESSDSNDGDRIMDRHRRMADPFDAGFPGGPRGLPLGLGGSLRAFSSMMTSGHSSQMRTILEHLRQKEDPSVQLMALDELSNILLVSNEDNLSGQFPTHEFVKELVVLMQPNELTDEENPDIMLLACRSLANLMEAMRNSIPHVVHGGAVPVLCQKLLAIHYIDVAEQALSTLHTISKDYPASIVQEGGLTACLQFLDFFATGTQRTAVQTASYCCRNLPIDSFPTIRDAMPILLNVLSSHDQKVVEYGCQCVTRIIDSFKNHHEKLEELVQPELLKAILGLLLPGTTNLIGPNIHTEFLKVLAIVARASPRLSVELLKMDVVDTLYQILTGVSAPRENLDGATKIDSVVVMQALIHRPREQVHEALSVICELLPEYKSDYLFDLEDASGFGGDFTNKSRPTMSRSTSAQKRIDLLKSCAKETRRFATILLPTLTDAYSSTVNLMVRQKVLSAQLKMLSNLETTVVEDALRPVPYASFLASILSQQDDPTLVMSALQASELLFERLQDIYQYQFHREGVIAEIKKLADRVLETDVDDASAKSKKGTSKALKDKLKRAASTNRRTDTDEDSSGDSEDDAAEHSDSDAEQDENQHDSNERDEDLDDSSDSNSSSDIGPPSPLESIQDFITARAKRFLELYAKSKCSDMREKAERILTDLQALAAKLRECYIGEGAGDGSDLFARLAKSFDGDALESITSAELLTSGIIQTLLDIFNAANSGFAAGDPRADYLNAFTKASIPIKTKTAEAIGSTTPLSVMIQKLQDLLSRSEHFEVLTVNHSSSGSSSSNATSMLSKQLRLKLTPEDGADVSSSFRELTVSIHAIATFKALDDYLRPRMSDRSRPDFRNRTPGDAIDRVDRLLAHARMRGIPIPEAMADPNFLRREHYGLKGSDSSRKQSKPSSNSKPSSAPPDPATSTTNKEDRPSTRRSTRKSMPSSSTAPPPPVAKAEDDDLAHALECADEKNVTDDESDENLDSRDDVGALVDDFEEMEEDDDESVEDPSAVNLEFASTGKVTAHKEDGTRVATPQQPGTPLSPSSRPPPPGGPTSASPLPMHPSLALAGRPYGSYAAALSSIPTDWHIEFSIDGKAIPKETTIYRAIYKSRDQTKDPTARNMWLATHSIKFKKVKGPPPESKSLHSSEEDSAPTPNAIMPDALAGHPTTSSILSLLGVLHGFNSDLAAVPNNTKVCEAVSPEPIAQFINTKLTAKLNRQLEEPLIVASNCLPTWSEDLTRLFPFLFPFETRHLFLQSTSFGYSRSMMRWQNNQSNSDDRRHRRDDDRPVIGRLQRQKVRISRSRILESAVKVMELYGASPSVLEVEYFEEVGTGLGPTLEFYSTVSKEFSKKKLKLWRENDSNGRDEYAFGKFGLFPAPMSSEQSRTEGGKRLIHFFKMLGKFVARSMLDSRIIDVSFNPAFFHIANTVDFTPTMALVKAVDQDLANSLSLLEKFAAEKERIEHDVHLSASKKVRAIQEIELQGAKIEDLMLDFTLPGYPNVELLTHGGSTPVTIDNVKMYLDRVLDLTLGTGVQRQIEAFREGFSQVFAFSSLRAFTASELVMLFGRVEEDWTIETLTDSVKADHGFNMDSKSVKNLLQTMSEFSAQQRRDFLQFVTGSPKLPIGGFKSLTPMFTIVCRPSEPPYTSDDYLPSVMTCANYLKLPNYSDIEVLKGRLNVAIRDGQGAFHLS